MPYLVLENTRRRHRSSFILDRVQKLNCVMSLPSGMLRTTFYALPLHSNDLFGSFFLFNDILYGTEQSDPNCEPP